MIGDSLSDQGNLVHRDRHAGPAVQHSADSRCPASIASAAFRTARTTSTCLRSKLRHHDCDRLGAWRHEFRVRRRAHGLQRRRGSASGAAWRRSTACIRPARSPSGASTTQREAFVDSPCKRHGADPTGLYIIFAGSNDLERCAVLSAFYDHDSSSRRRRAKSRAGVVDVVHRLQGSRRAHDPRTAHAGPRRRAGASRPARMPHGRSPASAVATLSFAQFNDAAACRAVGRSTDRTSSSSTRSRSWTTSSCIRPLSGFTNVAQPCFTGFVDARSDRDRVRDIPSSTRSGIASIRRRGSILDPRRCVFDALVQC